MIMRVSFLESRIVCYKLFIFVVALICCVHFPLTEINYLLLKIIHITGFL